MIAKIKEHWRLIVLGVVLAAYIVEFLWFLLETEGMRGQFFLYQFVISCLSLLVYFSLAVILHRQWDDPRQKLAYRTMNLAALIMTLVSLYIILDPVMIY